MRGEHNTWPSLSRAYQAPLLTTTMLTCPHLAVCLHLHAPPHRLACCTNCVDVAVPPTTACTALPSLLWLHASHRRPSCGCTHHVAVPLTAACIALPSPSQLHALRCCPPCSCMHHITVPLVAACMCRCAPCLLVCFLISYFY